MPKRSWLPLRGIADEKQYRKLILRKLLEHGYVGGRHTSEDNIAKGFPPAHHKSILEAYRQLKREVFFILKPKPDGVHISLNPRMLSQIRAAIEDP